MFRFILLAAAALVGGVTVGRSVVTKSVRGKVDKAVALAKARAEEDLRRETTAVVREKLAGVLLSTLWKILIVGAMYGLYKYGELTADGLQLAIILTTIGFACRDVYLVGPHLWRAYGYMRIHRWRPGEALREFIAGVVFDRAYEQALIATSQSGPRIGVGARSGRPVPRNRQRRLGCRASGKCSGRQIAGGCWRRCSACYFRRLRRFPLPRIICSLILTRP